MFFAIFGSAVELFWKWGKISCRGIKADVFIRVVWDSKILNSFCPNFLSIPVQTRNAQKVWDFFVFFLGQENQKSFYLLIEVSFLFVCFRFLFKYSQRPWDCMCMPQHKKSTISIGVLQFFFLQPGARTSGYNKTGPGKKKKLQHTERARCRKIPRKGVDQLPGKYLNFFVFVFAFVFQAYKCNRRGALGFGS